MGTRKQKRADGWKATRGGKRAHYFKAWVDELDQSLCGRVYDWEQLEPMGHDWLIASDYCKSCVYKFGPV